MRRVLVSVVLLLLLLVGAGAYVALHGDAGPAESDGRAATPGVPDVTAHGEAPRRVESAAPRRPRRPPEDAPETAPTPTESVPGGSESDDVDPAELRHVLVTVTHEGGAPVRGARVTGFGVWGSVILRPDPAETDVNGQAKLTVYGSATFRLRAALGHEAALGARVAIARGATVEQVLVLTSAVQLRGGVAAAATKAPVEGARVIAALPTDDPFGLTIEAETKADGSFALPLIPESYFAEPVALKVKADGYTEARLKVFAADLGGPPMLIELERGVTIHGRAVRVGGMPVPEVAVSVWSPRQTVHAKTDDRGAFELAGVPLDFGRIVFLPPEHAPRVLSDVSATGSALDLGDVLLDAGRPITGVVVDGAGKPIAGAAVQLRNDAADQKVRIAETDAEGRFALKHVGEGTHTLTVTAAAESDDWSSRTAVAIPGVVADGTDLRVVLSGKLSLAITFLLESDRSPVAVPEIKVEAFHRDTGEHALGRAWAGGSLTSVRVNFDEPGVYDVTVSLPGYVPATVEAIEVFPDREARLEALVRKAPE